MYVKSRFLTTFLALLCVATTAGTVAAEGLSLEDRVAAQRSIEEVYWRHRTWPDGNRGSKPLLSAVMPEAAIRARVEDYLKKSSALETLWMQPITAGQLQAELDRMARHSQDPDMLREIHAALGNDPYVIAETLARQALADRWIRDRYAFDARFHGQLERAARARLVHARGAVAMRGLGGKYLESRYAPRREATERGDPSTGAETVELDAAEWDDWNTRLAARFGNPERGIPLGTLSSLQQDAERFFVSAVLARSAREVTVATVAWRKTPFETWWKAEAQGLEVELPAGGATYSLAALAEAGCVDDTWERVVQSAVEGRYSHTAVWTGSEMIVWGGYGDGYLDTGGRYDPATDTWVATSRSGAPEGRFFHAAVWTGTEMIVWGGFRAGFVLDSGGRYDPVSDAWTPTSTAAGVPTARYSPTAVWTGTEMIVWGGVQTTGLTNTGGRYDLVTDTWTPTATTAGVPTPRYQHTAVWTGDRMIVWGGAIGANSSQVGGRYDPVTDTWLATSTGVGLPEGRRLHTAVWTGTEMIVWGGYRVAAVPYLNNGGRYNPTTDSWTATSMGTGVPSIRRRHTAVWTGTEMVIWGGEIPGGFFDIYANDGARYDPTTDGWTPTTSVGIPAGRFNHTAVWTGTEMIVWGGETLWGLIVPGGRYDPVTDTWITTALGGPSSRVRHSAVWTGAEMIVWGGWDNTGVTMNSGHRYDPTTDSLTATSAVGGPGARSGHTAVWTGAEMIVWGGVDESFAYVNTGGRYDPATDTWVSTSTPGAPAGRYWHTAVWSGSEMIVWGGENPFGPDNYLNSGGRYDPSTDGWTPTSTGANVPTGRYTHTAVWTGTEMIVWGGIDPQMIENGIFNDGGRYDPATDGWTPTSTGVDVPEVRGLHTAVWTGTEMIVWGGVGDSGLSLNNGGRYNPVTDGWMPTSTGANVPAERNEHTAVWTDSEMIVWGNNGSTGGRYRPDNDTWTATSTTGDVPGPRYRHTAVWTGSEMLVWGGADAPGTGGRYCAVLQAVELCNGVDDNDNGFIDEGFDLGLACDGPDGDLCDEGVTVCDALGAGTVCDDDTGNSDELCNGFDDDCDGSTDEGFALGVACDGSDADQCIEGVTVCNMSGSATTCGDTTGDTVETCNGLDDDCDGVLDEAYLRIQAQRRLTGGGSNVIVPLAGLAVGAYDASATACARTTCGGVSSAKYACIVASCAPATSGVTNAAGIVDFELVADSYVAIGGNGTNKQLGVLASALVCGQHVTKVLEESIKAKGVEPAP